MNKSAGVYLGRCRCIAMTGQTKAPPTLAHTRAHYLEPPLFCNVADSQSKPS